MVIMYNQEGESKYHVANILSSMANGGEPTVVVQVSSYATPYSSGNQSSVTSTLTPTTLNNFEQTFIELQSVPTATTTAHNSVMRSGFIPPVVSSMTSAHDMDSDSSTSCDDYLPTAPKKIRIGDKTTTIMSKYEIENPQRKTHRRLMKDEEVGVSPEEAARRNLRRERNKVAAAKCRQRRVDHTNRLLCETDKLEQEQSAIEQEIQSLQQEKDQLEFILQAHSPLCKAGRNNGALKIKNEPKSNNISDHASILKKESDKIMNLKKDMSTSRPSTLPLMKGDLKNQLTSAGIAITTPSSGFCSFSLDTMVDHTGLTPLTGSLGHSGFTPVTSMPSSCSTEATKKSSTSSENSEKSPSSLISL